MAHAIDRKKLRDRDTPKCSIKDCAYLVFCSSPTRCLFMVEQSIPALKVVLVFITIYLHIFFIENCPKLS